MRLQIPSYADLKVNGRRPTLPVGLRIYAIGDVHGRLDLLVKVLSLIEADILLNPVERPFCVFLGDYIDRGPQSRETLDMLLAYGAERESIFLKGNHELVATRCLSDRSRIEAWIRLGGFETLASYGVTVRNLSRTAEIQLAFHNALPQAHIKFFRELRASFECGDYFFAHAGIRPGVDLISQSEEDLLWIREKFLYSDFDAGKIIIHGHTPVEHIEIRPNRVNIDTGAYATNRLSCLVIEHNGMWSLDTAGW